MKITWIGQAGLLMQTGKMNILIDPYLSDSCRKLNPNSIRRVPVNEELFKIKPDVILLTHNHLDHTDPDTLVHYLRDFEGITVLAPQAAWDEARKFAGKHNYVKFNRHTSFTVGDVCFYAVKAEHTDPHPIGAIIEAEGKKYYVTGDTLYNEDIFSDIPNDIDVLFLPINGVGNNMNKADAARFAKRINAKKCVPLHHGMFDSLTLDDFDCENKVIPEVYKEIKL